MTRDKAAGRDPGGVPPPESSPETILELREVSKALGGRTVLDRLSLAVYRGETLVVLGRSGTGKSVTLRHIVGLETPDAGDVLYRGRSIASMTQDELRSFRQKLGFVFQSAALINWMSVYDNVALPLRENQRLPEDEVRAAVKEQLAIVGLENDGGKMPSSLSGGMKKRVGIARALAMRPEIILYDEPTAGLDPIMTRSIDDLILKTRDVSKATSVVVTHDLESAFRIADRLAMLDGGRVVAAADPETFRNLSEPAVRDFLSGEESANGPFEENKR